MLHQPRERVVSSRIVDEVPTRERDEADTRCWLCSAGCVEQVVPAFERDQIDGVGAQRRKTVRYEDRELAGSNHLERNLVVDVDVADVGQQRKFGSSWAEFAK